jgi:hypothetical protein
MSGKEFKDKVIDATRWSGIKNDWQFFRLLRRDAVGL